MVMMNKKVLIMHVKVVHTHVLDFTSQTQQPLKLVHNIHIFENSALT
jgi:hypothetical protein